METQGYKFYLFINGILKGKRKEITHKLDLGFYPEALSPELFNMVERKAWQEASEAFKSYAITGTLSAFKAIESNDFIFCSLLAEKSQKVMR